ncbi:potassium transporter Kup [Synoicihabitans lomoniglobus]|uniref:Probable potassium transport system protein Kup n=1 Tax=Synoicihabitans lomoniglobus TaxID=2909285 RepID=A0AAF0CS73_9BACT|nr:KUP/HAK/KT family potassium transporter [Opitutaceae bacterium LMO-M01]WED67057.1 KUP/HAK/KT family potassium transporter [Opitutaceae bacterium LMO-M01]
MSNAHSSADSASGLRIGLAIGALGVVFGDIGTSPLYALRESIEHLPVHERADGVFGVLSLIFWSLALVVSFKYATVVMRADNKGEGGIFALLALGGLDRGPQSKKKITWGVLVVLAGAAMICGEGVITPAISVLSAVEGLQVILPGMEDYVIPICIVILIALFWVQRHGTHRIGAMFGPVMLVWFSTLGLLGLYHIFTAPAVLGSLNPIHAVNLFQHHPELVTKILGSVVLAITGVEALYADMGHFGREAILRAWYGLVLPGLTLNYFGQGAYVIAHPEHTANPFLALAPEGPLRGALMLLSVFAAIIASQALISGTFSLVRQAMQLGYFPRLKVMHTNAEQRGQIYVPLINFGLAAGAIATVLLFKSSSALAAAYGIAVTGTMAVTTFALFFVMTRRWKWSIIPAALLCLFFWSIDLGFFFANLPKFFDGGWLPIAIGLTLLATMLTWKSGRLEIQEKVYGDAIAGIELGDIAKSSHIFRVPGSAIFMVGNPTGTPLALLHHLKANKALQETVVLLTILTEEVPTVPSEERLTLEEKGSGVWRAIGRYGYMESPNVAELCGRIAEAGVKVDVQSTTFYFNREMIVGGGNARMFEWQKALYAFLSRNARPVKDYYQILPTQVIEIGLPVQL